MTRINKMTILLACLFAFAGMPFNTMCADKVKYIPGFRTELTPVQEEDDGIGIEEVKTTKSSFSETGGGIATLSSDPTEIVFDDFEGVYIEQVIYDVTDRLRNIEDITDDKIYLHIFIRKSYEARDELGNDYPEGIVSDYTYEWTSSGGDVYHLNLTLEVAAEVDPEIKSLARGLNYDPDRMYEYVYNQIEYELIHRHASSPAMVLLNKKGTSFEQAGLLVALLKEAEKVNPDITDIRYVIGKIKLTEIEISNWYDCQDVTKILDLLDNNGQLGYYAHEEVAGDLNDNFILEHVWVQLKINGVTYIYDPSYKSLGFAETDFTEIDDSGVEYIRDNGEASIRENIDYNLSGLMSSIQASADSDYEIFMNFNEPDGTGLIDLLELYTNQLIDYFRSEDLYNISFDEFFGTRTINKVDVNSPDWVRETSQSKLEVGNTPTYYTEMPYAKKARLEVKIGEFDVTYYAADVNGRSLSLLFDDDDIPYIELDGILHGYGKYSLSSDNDKIELSLSTYHPIYPSTHGVEPCICSIIIGGTYNIINGWGANSSALVAKQRAKIQELFSQGLDGSDEKVIKESFALLGYTWLAEYQQYKQMIGQIKHLQLLDYVNLGVTGQYQGPYIDMPKCLGFYIGKNNEISKRDETAAIMVAATASSALEWGVWEQIQGIDAVSTVKMFDFAKDTGVYAVNKRNWNSILPELTGYSAQAIGEISNLLDDGFLLFISKAGNLGEGDWRGAAYMAMRFNQAQSTMISFPIDGGYQGGYSCLSEPIVPEYFPTTYEIFSANPPKGYEHAFTSYSGSNIRNTMIADPIDSLTGYYYYSNSDLSLGNHNGVTLTRNYSTGAKDIDGPFGLGWSHNHKIRAEVSGSFEQMSGAGSLVNAAPVIISILISIDAMHEYLIIEPEAFFEVVPVDHSLNLTVSATDYCLQNLPTNIINRSGMHNNGVCHSYGDLSISYYGDGNSMWLAPISSSITINFGRNVTWPLKMKIWNYNKMAHDGTSFIDYTKYGTKDLDVYFDEYYDPFNSGPISYELPRATGSKYYGLGDGYPYLDHDCYFNEHGTPFEISVQGTYVTLHCKSNFAGTGNYVGLSEVSFYEPEPSQPAPVPYASTMPKGIIPTYVHKWTMDQMLDNVVTITLPSETLQFVKLPDGTYEPPIGKNVTLLKDDEEFLLKLPNGVIIDFDDKGRADEISDASGNMTYYKYGRGSLEYDVISVKNQYGQYLKFLYEEDHITEVLDSEGRSIKYDYDDVWNLISYTNLMDDKTFYIYENMTEDGGRAGLMTELYNPKKNQDELTFPEIMTDYDEMGKAIHQVNSSYSEYDMFYSGVRTEMLFPAIEGERHSIETFYDRGNEYKKIDQTGKIYETEYDSLKRVVKLTNPSDLETVIEYDMNHNPKSTIAYPYEGSSKSPIETKSEYQTYENNDGRIFNLVDKTYDVKGQITDYDYDLDTDLVEGKGYLTKITYPQVTTKPGVVEIPVEEFTYYDNGQLKTKKGIDGIITQYEYDSKTGNLIKTIFDVGGIEQTTSMEYDQYGNVIKTIDYLDRETTAEYDIIGRPVRTIGPAPYYNESITDYNKNGQLKRLEESTVIPGEFNTSKYKYRIDGKIERIIDPLDRETLFEYDTLDRLWKTTDAENNTTEMTYYGDNSSKSVIDALDNPVTTNTYYDDGSLHTISDANGNVTTYGYDSDYRRLETITYEDATFTETTYDDYGRVYKFKTREGDEFIYTYDEYDRLKTKGLLDNGVENRLVTYTYDINGNITTVYDHKNNQETNYDYDYLSRLKQVTYYDNKTVKYEYDDQTQLIDKLIYPDNSFVTYSYDELDRLIAINDENGEFIAKYEYDSLSRRTQVKYANTTKAIYSYDSIDRLVGIDNKYVNTNQEFEYLNFDQVDNRTSMRRNGVDTTYEYDDIYQLTDVDYPENYFVYDRTYNYDDVGNRDDVDYLYYGQTYTVDYTPNNMNQYSQYNGVTLQYDDNGNLEFDGRNNYIYDEENQLIAANTFKYPNYGITYTYDANGRRIRKNLGGQITDYLYDGNHVLCEYDGTGALKRKFIYGPGIDEPIKMVCYTNAADLTDNGSVTIDDLIVLADSWLTNAASGNYNEAADLNLDGKINNADLDIMAANWMAAQSYQIPVEYYYHYDGSGNVIALSSEFGLCVQEINYDVYGQCDTEKLIANPYLFSARRFDPETGLYYFRARYYSTYLGRFMQTDPIGYDDGINWYAYCGNNPVMFFDPLGLCSGYMNGESYEYTTWEKVEAYYYGFFEGGAYTAAAQYGLVDQRKVDNMVNNRTLSNIGKGSKIVSDVAFVSAGVVALGQQVAKQGFKQAVKETAKDAIGFNKCFTEETSVLSIEGQILISEIELGDFVYTDEYNSDIELGTKVESENKIDHDSESNLQISEKLQDPAEINPEGK